ncbi:MAG: type IV toxin-antitoxin system AbiEi family antitoxin domain-containing protein [Solirubrobacteraceae bacterium]
MTAEAILALARRQQGNITRKQLLALGLGPAAIAHRVQTKRLHRVHRGVYAVGRPPSMPVERAAAAVLACGDEAALSHSSALTLWGFATRWPAPMHVSVSGDRRRPGIVVHQTRGLTRADIRTHLGIRVTSPARTVLDCAPTLTTKRLTRIVNDGRRSGRLRPDALDDVRRRFPNHPGTRPLAQILDGSPGAPTRSVFEDAFVAFCQRFDLPRPRVNASVAGYEVDALFAAERLIVELDGWRFHNDRAAFETDRLRDADALTLGLATVRVTWERMTKTPQREAARLKRILARRRLDLGLDPMAPG